LVEGGHRGLRFRVAVPGVPQKNLEGGLVVGRLEQLVGAHRARWGRGRGTVVELVRMASNEDVWVGGHPVKAALSGRVSFVDRFGVVLRRLDAISFDLAG